MSSAEPGQVTQILDAISGGDPDASDRLLESVYDELRTLAHRRLRHEPADLTLEATALVHEAYLRLVGKQPLQWNSRGHFFGAAAEAMRRILVERARRYASRKHGGGRRRVPLDRADAEGEPAAGGEQVLAVHEALSKLEAEAPDRAQVVKLRYFAGLTVEETAEVLGVAPITVKRRSALGLAWLSREIGRADERDEFSESPDRP